MPDVKMVELEDKYYHVRFRDPDSFDQIRTPDWAANAASPVSEGAEVRMGRKKEGGDWMIESVLIQKGDAGDEDGARRKAKNIVRKIEA